MLRDLFFIEFIEAIFAATASVVERDYAGLRFLPSGASAGRRASSASLSAETLTSAPCSMWLSKGHKAQAGGEGRAVDQVFEVDAPSIKVGKIPGQVGAGVQDRGAGQETGESGW